MTVGIFTGPGRPWLLGRLAGIPIRLQPLLLALVMVLSLSRALAEGWQVGVLTLLVLLVVTASVLLHELGHALVARRLGVGVVDITLWPLGGVAVLNRMPEDPGVESAIALAGPLVNFSIAALALLAAIGLGVLAGSLGFPANAALNITSLLAVLLWVNLVMGLFNLLPAFPMDGGKILRSLVSRRRGWLAGTELACGIGRAFGWGMVLFGWTYSLSFPLLGLFLLYAGKRELLLVRMRHAPETVGLGGILLSGLIRRPGARDREGPQARRGWPADTQATGQPGSESRSGFSDEDVRRMEAHHGPLGNLRRRGEAPGDEQPFEKVL